MPSSTTTTTIRKVCGRDWRWTVARVAIWRELWHFVRSRKRYFGVGMHGRRSAEINTFSPSGRRMVTSIEKKRIKTAQLHKNNTYSILSDALKGKIKGKSRGNKRTYCRVAEREETTRVHWIRLEKKNQTKTRISNEKTCQRKEIVCNIYLISIHHHLSNLILIIVVIIVFFTLFSSRFLFYLLLVVFFPDSVSDIFRAFFLRSVLNVRSSKSLGCARNTRCHQCPTQFSSSSSFSSSASVVPNRE